MKKPGSIRSKRMLPGFFIIYKWYILLPSYPSLKLQYDKYAFLQYGPETTLIPDTLLHTVYDSKAR